MTATDYSALQLDDIPATAWQLLEDGVHQGRSPFHTPALATLGDQGPEVRTVVLRDADYESAALCVHTDRRSPKFKHLAESPRVGVLFYDRQRKVQLRCNGLASLHVDDDMAEARWQSSSQNSRQCYRLSNAPGTAFEQPPAELPLMDGNGRAHFAVVRIRLTRLDWLYLRAAGHQRARFEYRDGAWQGTWIAP